MGELGRGPHSGANWSLTCRSASHQTQPHAHAPSTCSAGEALEHRKEIWLRSCMAWRAPPSPPLAPLSLPPSGHGSSGHGSSGGYGSKASAAHGGGYGAPAAAHGGGYGGHAPAAAAARDGESVFQVQGPTPCACTHACMGSSSGDLAAALVVAPPPHTHTHGIRTRTRHTRFERRRCLTGCFAPALLRSLQAGTGTWNGPAPRGYRHAQQAPPAPPATIAEPDFVRLATGAKMPIIGMGTAALKEASSVK